MQLRRIHGSYLISILATALAAIPYDAHAGEAGNDGATADDAATADAIIVLGARETRMTQTSSTGSRLGHTVLETPASITMINGDRMRLRGDQDIQAAVTRAPGVSTSANPGNGGTTLAVRGFSGQGSVLQLYDGVRLFPVAGTITFPVDPWTVERIEVLNGPASVLFGPGSLGGAINVIPRGPNAERTEIEAEAGYGAQDSIHAAAGIGGPLGAAFSYRLDASYRRSDGFLDRGDSRSLALSGALRFRPSPAFSLTLRNDYGNQRPTEYFGTPLIAGRLVDGNQRRNYNVADASLHYRDNRTSLTADWEIADGLTLNQTAYRLTSKRLFRNLESYFYNGASGQIDRFDNLGISCALVRPSRARIIAVAARLIPHNRIERVEELTCTDAYWYQAKGQVELPILRVVFDDPARTWVHISPRTGEIVGESTSRTRLYRWLYDGLHRWDCKPLIEHRPLWDAWMWLWLVPGLAICATGVVIGYRRLSR